MLCPVALDDAWKSCKWPERLREQIKEYNILDFSRWKENEEFGKMFRKLVEGLDLFYKGRSVEIGDKEKSVETSDKEKPLESGDHGYWFDGWVA